MRLQHPDDPHAIRVTGEKLFESFVRNHCLPRSSWQTKWSITAMLFSTISTLLPFVQYLHWTAELETNQAAVATPCMTSKTLKK